MLLWGLFLLGLALYWLPLRGVSATEVTEIGGLGLVEILPLTTLAGGALLIASFAGALVPARPQKALLAVILLATVVSLHAVPALLEAEPRFPTAWQHLGFLEYLDRIGSVAPELDARWSWPGFFAVVAFFSQATGVTDLTEVIRWWPLAVQLVYLAPMALLLRSVKASWRAKWCALWLFALSGWIGQDYFSPQAFTYLLYLTFFALLLVWFRPRTPAVLHGGRTPGEAPVPALPRETRAVLLALVIGLFAVCVTAHQLTPFVMVGVLTALVLVRRSVLRGLPLLFFVMLAAWVVFLAEPYWSGHFEELFGGIGGVGGNLSSSVSGRVEGGSDVHTLVLYTRIALAGAMLALAGWGLLRRRGRGISDRSLLVLTAVPFFAFVLQSYGGEMALRVFLFALPGACVLAALAFFPRHPDRPGGTRRWLAPSAVLLSGLVLLGGFLVARWGNEAFEQVRPGEVAAMEAVYEQDQPSARLLWLSGDPKVEVTPALPWGARDMERVTYKPVAAPYQPSQVASLVDELREAGPNSYLIVNRSQGDFLELNSGYPSGWSERLRADLDERADLKRSFANEDAALYTLAEPPTGAVPQPSPGPPGPQVTWDEWSVAGALCGCVVLVLLVWREFVRIVVPAGPRQEMWLSGLLWFSHPLLFVFVASLAYRLTTLS